MKTMPIQKAFTMRLPKDMWLFVKHQAATQEVSMTEIIMNCIDKYKKKIDKRLTDTDT